MTNKKMKPKTKKKMKRETPQVKSPAGKIYWIIEAVTGDWEVDVALERCERVGLFRHKRKPILNREL